MTSCRVVWCLQRLIHCQRISPLLDVQSIRPWYALAAPRMGLLGWVSGEGFISASGLYQPSGLLTPHPKAVVCHITWEVPCCNGGADTLSGTWPWCWDALNACCRLLACVI